MGDGDVVREGLWGGGPGEDKGGNREVVGEGLYYGEDLGEGIWGKWGGGWGGVMGGYGDIRPDPPPPPPTF